MKIKGTKPTNTIPCPCNWKNGEWCSTCRPETPKSYSNSTRTIKAGEHRGVQYMIEQESQGSDLRSPWPARGQRAVGRLVL